MSGPTSFERERTSSSKIDPRLYRRGAPVLRAVCPAGYESTRGGETCAERRPVFVTFVGRENHLDTKGIQVRALAPSATSCGHIATALLDGREIDRLAADPAVHHIEIGAPLPLPVAPDERGGPESRQRGFESCGRLDGLPFVDASAPEIRGQDGSGVVVGIVDQGGIDLDPAFDLRGGGGSRIEAIWDQTLCPDLAGAPTAHHGTGILYTRERIASEHRRRGPAVRTALCRGADPTDSHASKVAFIAAGLRQPHGSLRGIAPGANIVFVNVPDSGSSALASMTSVAEAVDFVFRQAGSRPCVVNLSLGDLLGPHDGSSPVERFFTNLITSARLRGLGRAIVVASGNFGQRVQHLTGRLSAEEIVAPLVAGEREQDPCGIEIWVPAGVHVDVVVESPDHGATPRIALGDRLYTTTLEGTLVQVCSQIDYPGNGDSFFHVDLSPDEGSRFIAGGEWKIHILPRGHAEGAWHAWIDHPFIAWQRPRGGGLLANRLTASAPATCPDVIAVGACDPRQRRVAPFTGSGLLRGGGCFRPDVLAPGDGVPTLCRSAPGGRVKFNGTSAAAPIVTGVVARLFQKHGAGADIRGLLRRFPPLSQGLTDSP